MIKKTTVSSTAIRLLIPGPGCKLFVLQNNGASGVRLSFDGGSDMPTGQGTLPTATTGYKLATNTQFVATIAQFPSIGTRNVWAIAEGADVAIDVITDDKDST